MKIRLALALSAVALLAGCQSAPMAAKPEAPTAQQACTEKLAETARRPASDIRALGASPTPNGGFSVMLTLAGAPWSCRVDPAGNATVQFRGAG